MPWTLFTSSADVHAIGFKREFAPVAAALGQARAPLSVVYLVGDGKKVGCKPWGPFGCERQCTNNGRYCATDPDGDVTKVRVHHLFSTNVAGYLAATCDI